MSTGLPARAGRLIALEFISYVFFRLLLICDVESALSFLAAVGRPCCLRVRHAQALSCRVEVSRRLDDEVEGHIDYARPYR